MGQALRVRPYSLGFRASWACLGAGFSGSRRAREYAPVNGCSIDAARKCAKVAAVARCPGWSIN